MITLYHFADDWGFDPSPFCLKMETYLKLARVPFEKAYKSRRIPASAEKETALNCRRRKSGR